MVYINLLPVRKIKKRIHAKQQMYALGATFILILVVLGGLIFMQTSTVSTLNKDITYLQNEKKRHTKVLAQIKTIEESKKLLEKQIGIINQLNKSSALTVHILDEVSRYTPTERMWLTSLNQSGPNLQLSGMALDNRTIASFLDELRKSDYVDDINLTSASLQQFAGRNLKTFSITASISVPQEKQDN
jgi:type IV pilus assembly protein PilN